MDDQTGVMDIMDRDGCDDPSSSGCLIYRLLFHAECGSDRRLEFALQELL
jgi:hypothetical protein